MLPNIDEIKTRRIKLGLNQSSLAKLTGISRASISKLENRKADLRYSRVKAVFDVLEELERQSSSEDGFVGVILEKIHMSPLVGMGSSKRVGKYDIILDEFLISKSNCSKVKVEQKNPYYVRGRLNNRIKKRNLKLISYVCKGITFIQKGSETNSL